MHLLMHAQTFGTLTNIQVGIKEMVHRIFKEIVPKTNRKNIDLDLVKWYNTLFAIRHLADGGTDPRFASSCASFANSNFEIFFQIGTLLRINSQIRAKIRIVMVRL